MGLGILVASWILTGDTPVSRWNDVIVGVALIGLSIPRGRIEERFDGWNRYLIW